VEFGESEEADYIGRDETMNGSDLMGFGLAVIVMVIGLIGTVIPGIPGAPLILAAAVIHKIYFRGAGASYFVLMVLTLLTVLSLVLDFLGTMFGAKKLGATWRGIVGAMIGAMAGIFFSLPGLILGPIIGAFLFEFLGGREWKESARAGAGALLGMFLGAVGKAVCCVLMIAIFSLSVFLNSRRAPDSSPAQVAREGKETALADFTASRKPRAFARVSSYSASGEESATIPAPTLK
jgi:uncharacterized protein YqgC (DUF456 family)